MTSEPVRIPRWFADYLGISPGAERAQVRDQALVLRDGILRDASLTGSTQEQTARTFGYKWQQRDTFESPAMRGHIREWLDQRYGRAVDFDWWAGYGHRPLVVDAGCGGGWSGLEYFRDLLGRIRYLGVDVSDAVEVAARRIREAGFDDTAFLQASISRLPLPPDSVDVIFAEGVLHHTDSTEHALKALAKLLRPGGRFLFYVYRRKGPIREFTDDYLRRQLQALTPGEAWEAMKPLTRLGKSLGELDVEVEVPEAIPLLGIPAGRINVQRLFYWHVLKAYYRPELTLEEMNHINFDWYAPANAHRQSPEDVRAWCAEAGLDIEREIVEEAGITVIAKKRG